MKFRFFTSIIITITTFITGGCAKIDPGNLIDQTNQTPPVANVNIDKEIPKTAASSESKQVLPEAKPDTNTNQKNNAGNVNSQDIPRYLNYPVAFVSQAPYAVWDSLHGEACEEASMIIVDKYFNNEPLTAHIMEQEILNLVKWEKDNGYKVDLTTEETTEILKSYFGLKAELITEVTATRIKQELIGKKLLIIPAAGRKLGNPYFQQPGPIYHMLVIRGYDDTSGEFITNDVGTKRGEGFRYKYEKLIDAIHDWNHSFAEGGMTDSEMEMGRKVLISVQNF